MYALCIYHEEVVLQSLDNVCFFSIVFLKVLTAPRVKFIGIFVAASKELAKQ